MTTPDLSRRKFVKKGLVFFAGVAVAGVYACKNVEEIGECNTTKDILGPFYRSDAPERDNLNWTGQMNDRISISGKVFASDCKTVIPEAEIEVWHCDEQGEYDNSSPDFLYRGTVLTGNDGSYGFETIFPGRYKNGNTYRPSHIHLKITATGHKELVTQLYFEGDPYIQSDPWASDESAKDRILQLEEQEAGLSRAEFNIYLQE